MRPLALVVLIALGAPAHACLNDTSSSSTEREFVSRYALAASSPQGRWNRIGLVVAILGAAMVGACVTLALNGKPKQ